MRRFVKFAHTMGAIGLIGAMACLLVLLGFLPPPTSLSEYAVMRGAMGGIASWIFLPSLGLTLVAGLLAMAVNRAFHNAGWAWVKLASGVLVFEWGFAAVQGPMQEEAELSARALAHEVDLSTLGTSLGAEWKSLWIMLALAILNVVLGIWRPRLKRLGETRGSAATIEPPTSEISRRSSEGQFPRPVAASDIRTTD
jgi:hypothetical protein